MNISVVQNWSDFGWPSCICQYCACLAIMSNRVCKRRFVVQFPHRTGGTSENLGEGAKSKTRFFDGTVCASDLAKIWRGFGGKLPPSPFLPQVLPHISIDSTAAAFLLRTTITLLTIKCRTLLISYFVKVI